MSSYLESTARERIRRLFDAGTFKEFLPPSERVISPHLAQLDAPVSFDDGVIVGRGRLDGRPVFGAAQEGGFMGGAVGKCMAPSWSACCSGRSTSRPTA